MCIRSPFFTPRRSESQCCQVMFVCLLFTTFILRVSLGFHLYFYTPLSIRPSSDASTSSSLSLYVCLHTSVSPLHPDCHAMWFACLSTSFTLFLSLCLCSIPVSPSSSPSLSFSLRSVTYLQHSCLMNNGGETVTISVSISRIQALISAPLPFPAAFSHNFTPKLFHFFFLLSVSSFFSFFFLTLLQKKM